MQRQGCQVAHGTSTSPVGISCLPFSSAEVPYAIRTNSERTDCAFWNKSLAVLSSKASCKIPLRSRSR